MLVNLKQWRDTTFAEGSRPHLATVRRWCEKGEISARKVGSQWFVKESDEAELMLPDPNQNIKLASILNRL